MRHPNDERGRGPGVGLDEWIGLLRPLKGRYSVSGVAPRIFTGAVQTQSVCGLDAVDIACRLPSLGDANGVRAARTQSDVRVDGLENYYALFQIAGCSSVEQNDQAVDLVAGDIALVDSTLPVSYAVGSDKSRWLSLLLPRQSFVSMLGSEPKRRACGHIETPARQLLFQLAAQAIANPEMTCAMSEPYLRLVVYDLIGALFVASDLPSVTPHSDKIFGRVCGIIRDEFTDPDICSLRVAEEAGISLRYLQKLFTARGTTFCQWLYEVRLEHAAQLLRHRAKLKTGQPLSMIAYASGFRDYSHFARAFRRRFGQIPGRI